MTPVIRVEAPGIILAAQYRLLFLVRQGKHGASLMQDVFDQVGGNAVIDYQEKAPDPAGLHDAVNCGAGRRTRRILQQIGNVNNRHLLID